MSASALRPTFEASVRESDDLYRTFFAHSNEGIWRFELRRPMPVSLPVQEQLEYCYAESVLEECNAAMAAMYGFESPRDLVGASLDSLLPPTDPDARAFLTAFLSSDYRLIGVESNERTLQGDERIFLNSLVGIVEDGHLVRVWGTQSDITASKQMERHLRRSQRMEAIGRLAGGIAHDFNNVLAIILTSSEMMLESGSLDPDARDDAERIKSAAASGAGLTQQLLAFSRRQHLSPQRVDLNAVVAETDKLMRRLLSAGIAFETSFDADIPVIVADPGQVQQVILNLVVNARDAMPAGGTLRVSTGSTIVETSGTPRGDAEGAPGSYVTLTVSDTGHGMDAETRSRIFEPFFSTKAEGHGTGLGLSTVYGIVRQSGGFIRVESVVGEGTTFQVLLPAVEEL